MPKDELIEHAGLDSVIYLWIYRIGYVCGSFMFSPPCNRLYLLFVVRLRIILLEQLKFSIRPLPLYLDHFIILAMLLLSMTLDTTSSSPSNLLIFWLLSFCFCRSLVPLNLLTILSL
jgi:hypothetical protein